MPGFLVEYHRRSGKVKVTEYGSLVEALEHCFVREQEITDPEVEVVAISAASEAQLRQSHSRYFAFA